VVASDGTVGGFSASGGRDTKLRLLALEGRDRAGALFDGDGALGFDPAAAVAHLRAADPRLAAVIDASGPLRLQVKRNASVFVALAESIVYQQLNGRAAATIWGRVCALFPRPHDGLTAEKILGATDARLRGAGLSRAKLLALRDLAQRTASGELPTLAQVHSMPDDEVVERLTVVRGIGRWTAEMFLMFRLGRPDVLPVDDYGVRNGFRIAYRKRELPSRELLLTHAERWRPYRSAASWYLWRAADAKAA
jgi:3-methyladenine DNA glycosylase/8-oxoguanine DNA glycosylase